jgi:predicted metal-binding protein
MFITDVLEDYNVVPTHNASDLIKCDQMPYINHKGKFLEDYNVVPTHNASDLIKCDQMPYINHKGKFRVGTTL